MSLFDHVIAEGLSSVRAIAGRQVKYTRAADGESITITAVKSVKPYTAIDRNGVLVKHMLTDWLIASCDLVIDGVIFEPKDGDTITERVGAKLHKHSVSFPSGGNVFDYSDTGHSQLRIHTVARGVTNA